MDAGPFPKHLVPLQGFAGPLLSTADAAPGTKSGTIPESSSPVALQDPDPETKLLKLSNLDALDIWKTYVEESEGRDNDRFNGLGYQIKEAWELWRHGLGRTKRDDVTRGWALERRLIQAVERCLTSGMAHTLFDALYLIDQGLFKVSGKEVHRIRSRARHYLGHDRHHNPSLITRLIRYTHHATPSNPRAVALLTEAFTQLEAKEELLQSAYAIYNLVHELSAGTPIARKAKGHLDALQGKSTFHRAARKFLHGLSPWEVGFNVGAFFLAGGLAHLAKLATALRLERMGFVGLKAAATSSVTAWGVEVGTFGTLQNLHWLVNHDPASLSTKAFTASYKSAATMIGTIRLFGQATKFGAPLLAETMGWAAPSPLLAGALGHGAGLGGMVASSRLNQAWGWQEKPIGGSAENWAHDILGYGEFALAQGMLRATANGLSGGKFRHLQMKQELESRAALARLLQATPQPTTKLGAGVLTGMSCFFYPELAQAMTPFTEGQGPALGLKTLLFLSGALAMAGKRSGNPKSLRRYQKEMLSGLSGDMKANTAPWLGLASPMQTGKSHLIPHIMTRAEKIYGKETEFIVLSSARIITHQLLKDLLGHYDPARVGQFDGHVKRPRPITVASIHTLRQKKHLERFPLDGRQRVIIMDEAYFTQTPTVGRILAYFGLAQQAGSQSKRRWDPKVSPDTVLLGLSGTAEGLNGYQVSGRLTLLDAIEAGWIRSMDGERVFPQIPLERRKSGQERMVWWRPDAASAQVLAGHYQEKIQGRYDKNLVYVPTLKHGRLLMAALRQGGERVHFVHSQMKPAEIEAALATWQSQGGALLSVRMLSHGFRAGDVGAVFHTYQTSSPELFAQRTGRAWAGGGKDGQSPLFVLEAAWDRERFSNLARLLGLLEYPRGPLQARPGLKRRVAKIQKRLAREADLQKKILQGKVLPYFAHMPLLESWRGEMTRIRKQHPLSKLKQVTGLDSERLEAFALGVLPATTREVLALAPFLGGEAAALRLWVKSWERVVKEFASGERNLMDPLKNSLLAWARSSEAIETKAQSLEEWLAPHIRVPRASIQDTRKVQAFHRAIALFESRGSRVYPLQVSQQAYEYYIEGLPKAQWPSPRTFHNMLTGPRKDPELCALLAASKFVHGQVKIDPQRKVEAFDQAIAHFHSQQKKAGLLEVATLAYEIYVQGLEKHEHPSPSTFPNLVSGKRRDREIVSRLESSGVLVKNKAKLNPDRVYWAFGQAINRMKSRGEKVGLLESAHLAHEIYIQGLPPSQHPSRGTFGGIVSGRKKDPKIVKMLEEQGILAKQKIYVDPKRKQWAFEQALQELQVEGKFFNRQQVADRIHAFYTRDLPESQCPKLKTFRLMLIGSSANSAWLLRLRAAGILAAKSHPTFN